MTSAARRLALGAIFVVVAASIWYLQSQKADRPSGQSVAITTGKTGAYPQAVEISTPDAFINTDGITVGELVGKKVILVDFWTYSCINCQRTLPYLNAWYDKYRDQGLEILGVHTPEFEFEKKLENVQKAVDRFNIEYPVILDNDFSTWTAYRNRYWPRKYLIDINGHIVYDHIGEGAYDETEARIQEVLKERAVALNEEVQVATDMAKPVGAITDMLANRSPEIYFGASRNERLGNGAVGREGEASFTLPESFKDSTFYLSGRWDLQSEFARNVSEGSLVFRYRAMNVYMVARAEKELVVKVLRDGRPVTGVEAGADVQNGVMRVQEDRLYHLIAEPSGSEHMLELIIEEPGLEAFTFTFG